MEVVIGPAGSRVMGSLSGWMHATNFLSERNTIVIYKGTFTTQDPQMGSLSGWMHATNFLSERNTIVIYKGTFTTQDPHARSNNYGNNKVGKLH